MDSIHGIYHVAHIAVAIVNGFGILKYDIISVLRVLRVLSYLL